MICLSFSFFIAGGVGAGDGNVISLSLEVKLPLAKALGTVL